jgi:8-oxo-dGTP pyrophosphatase MutT (NUDIX family)
MKWWHRLGIISFWLSWPLLWLYLHNSQRSRVLIICDGKLVVVKGWLSDGKWSLPGGGVHRHETLLPAAIREVQEETGLSLVAKQLREIGQERYREKGLSFDCHFFLVKLNTLATLQRQGIEISAVAWLDRHSLTPANCNQSVFRALSIWSTQSASLLQ